MKVCCKLVIANAGGDVQEERKRYNTIRELWVPACPVDGGAEKKEKKKIKNKEERGQQHLPNLHNFVDSLTPLKV